MSWHSVSNKVYSVLHCTSLQEPWSLSRSNIAATPPLNVHTVTMDSVGEFYSIGLEE